MDSWSNDQVEHMKRNGNTNTNRTYNPQNQKPPIPLDVDEVDAVLERFIRQKYDQQLFTGSSNRAARKNDTGSTRSSEDQPPPLPPKPGKRFGFGLRSASSALPLQCNDVTFPPQSPKASTGWGDEPLRVNKQSRVFGASVGGNNYDLDSKLDQLRDMGFSDEKRNINVLKGLGGNLERALESLVRLGDGSAPASRARTPIQPRNVAVSLPMTNGISSANNGSVSRNDTGSTGQQSTQGSAALQQQAAARSFSLANENQPQIQGYNPFDTSHDQRAGMASLDQSFSDMHVSQQPLFPNATGGYPNQLYPAPGARLQTMTPPIPQMPHQFTQLNPYVQQSENLNSVCNPLYQPIQQSMPASSNSAPNTQAQNAALSYNPFQQTSTTSAPQVGYSTDLPQTSSSQMQQSFFQQQQQPSNQMQQQQPLFQHQASQQPQQILFASQNSFTNPVQYGIRDRQQPQQPFNPNRTQSLQPQQTGRIDKASILALFNSPQLVPAPLPNHTDNAPNNVTGEQSNPVPPPNAAPQRSVTMPIQASIGSRNPFQSSTNPSHNANATPPGVGRHMSQESVDIGGYQNGRHSPDLYASLSARYVR
ncbi:MAG: hypothetical protein Q9217_002452 [Psora testacea]